MDLLSEFLGFYIVLSSSSSHSGISFYCTPSIVWMVLQHVMFEANFCNSVVDWRSDNELRTFVCLTAAIMYLYINIAYSHMPEYSVYTTPDIFHGYTSIRNDDDNVVQYMQSTTSIETNLTMLWYAFQRLPICMKRSFNPEFGLCYTINCCTHINVCVRIKHKDNTFGKFVLQTIHISIYIYICELKNGIRHAEKIGRRRRRLI